jgi:hypothetical protein
LEAIAIKNLQGILRERGYTAEALFSKFDSNGDGVLSKSEFESALRSITGQVAPNAIVNAVFGALDEDSSGQIDLTELLSIMDSGGQSYSLQEGGAINVSGHTNAVFNGIYKTSTQINGKTSYKSDGGMVLYHFNSDSSGSSSWNLDDREQDGSNDWYRGGWTKANSDGTLPLGTRRWVGVGKLSIVPRAEHSESSSSSSVDIGHLEPMVSGNEDLGSLLEEIDLAVNYFEEQVTEGKISPDQAMEMADAAFERKIADIPSFMQSPARKLWDSKTAELEGRLKGKLPDSTAIASSVAAIGVAGAVLADARENIPDVQAEPVTEPAPEPVTEPAPEPVTEPAPEPVTEPAPEPVTEPAPEPVSESQPTIPLDSVGLDLNEAIFAFTESRMLSERAQLKQKFAGKSGKVNIRVSSIERTFGIGISDEYRGGSTLIANIGEVGEVEIRLPASSDSNNYRAGTEEEILVSIADWNAVRKRLVLESQ